MIDFDTFCTKQMLGGRDRLAFKAWLGHVAGTLMSESMWLAWFVEWVRSRKS